jgi:hypothetical protein
MTATCQACSQQWPRDPALEVPCPTCNAPVGIKCKRPSGHGCQPHAARDTAAMVAGVLQKCPAARDERKEAQFDLWGMP